MNRVKNFSDLFEKAGLRTRMPCGPLPFGCKLAENFLRLGQIMFSPRFVVRLLIGQRGGFAHDFILRKTALSATAS